MHAFLDANGYTILADQGACPAGQAPVLPPVLPGFYRALSSVELHAEGTTWETYDRQMVMPRKGEA